MVTARRKPVFSILVISVMVTLARPSNAGFAGTDLFLPMVGRQAGVYPSNWYTTVWVHNPGSQAATARVYFLERGTANLSPPWVDVLVAPGDTEKIVNVVESLFQRQAYGALRVTCATQKLVVTSRVYSKLAGGDDTDSLGQDFAGVPGSFAIGMGEKTQILGVHQTQPSGTSEFRYNFGAVETTGHTATVRFTAYDDNGTDLGHTDLQVREHSQRQVAFKDHFPGVSEENARLEAEVIAGTGKVIAYGSAIANGSQDPTTFEMTYSDTLLAGGLTAVQHDTTLVGDGTAGAPLGLADGAVTLAKLGTTNSPAPPVGSLVTSAAGTPSVLTTDGSALSWQPQGGLVLPWSGQTAQSTTGAAFAVVNVGGGMYGLSGAGANGVYGSGSARGVWGSSGSGTGVEGDSAVGSGVLGVSTSALGVIGRQGAGSSMSPPTAAGVFGDGNTAPGVIGYSQGGDGVHGTAGAGGYGVFGAAPSTGVYGSGGSQGVHGDSGSGSGVFGTSVTNSGVRGVSASGTGVEGISTSSYGVRGASTTGDGVFGSAAAAFKSGIYGVNPNPAGYAGYFGGRVGITGELECGGCVKADAVAGSAITKAKLAATGGTAGQLLGTDDGSTLSWRNDGLTLPYWKELPGSADGVSFGLRSNHPQSVGVLAVQGSSTLGAWGPPGGIGIYGIGQGAGVYGQSDTGAGISGAAEVAAGVEAFSSLSDALKAGYAGRHGLLVAEAHDDGVHVTSATHDGIEVTSAGWSGVYVNSAGFDALRVQSAGQDGLRFFASVARDFIRAGDDSNLRFRVTNSGAAYADGGWNGAADFAELVRGDTDAGSLGPADVVVIGEAADRTVVRSSTPYSTLVAGIYSTKPGFVGSPHPTSEALPGELPVAMVGIVPCKVSAENGAIRRGDLLVTAATPGHAMRADNPPPGTVVAKALQPLGAGTGVIEVLVSLQ